MFRSLLRAITHPENVRTIVSTTLGTLLAWALVFALLVAMQWLGR